MRRLARVLSFVALGAAVSLSIPSVASAQQSAAVAEGAGSVTIHSEAGDFIGKGRDYSYTRPYDQVWGTGYRGGNRMYLSVDGLNGDRWTLDFAAPDGQPLAVGDYPDAQGSPFQEPGHPGIRVIQGFTCQTLTGSFSVLEIGYDANGRVDRFHATFEQHCNGAAAGLTGEIVYTAPPPQPRLQYVVAVDRLVSVSDSGFMTVTGTLTCNQHVWTSVSAALSQGWKYTSGHTYVSCSPGEVVRWTAYADSSGDPFTVGRAQVHAYASGKDGYQGTIETGSTEGDVVLVPARR